MPAASQDEFEQCAIRVRFIVGDVPTHDLASGQPEVGKYHYFSGQEGGDSIYYERTLLGTRKLQLRIDGLLGDEPVLIVNPAYLKYVTHRFMNLHSAGYVMTDIVSLLLLRHGYSPVHCSAFRTDEATVLILAPPNTGKTLASMQACIDHDAEFLAEDLAITDGKTLYGVPWTSTFRYYGEIESGRMARVANTVQRYVPPLELLSLSKPKPVGTLIPSHRIVPQSTITHVAILERGRSAIVPLDIDTAVRKAVNLNRYEFNYVKAPALVAYEFFNPSLDLDAAAAEERRVLRTVMEQADEVFVVKTPDATQYARMILDRVA